MWFKAKSKKRGLHGTDNICGGTWAMLGWLEINPGSSTYSSRRLMSIWKMKCKFYLISYGLLNMFILHVET